MIGTPNQDAFLNRTKMAVVTTLRKDGSPASSVIFFARDGDTLFFSTTASRFKARSLANDARIAITAVEDPPAYGYVTVEGTATILSPEHGDDIITPHLKLQETMTGQPVQVSDQLRERLAREGRVIVRVTPTRVHGVTERPRPAPSPQA